MIEKFAAAQSSQFEQQFFQLAYSKLQDKAGLLLPYLVGFELVKKSDDGVKAVGTFGFQLQAGTVLMIPVFFQNGNISPLEILYNRTNDQYFPLKDAIISDFIKDDSGRLGQPTSDSEDKMRKQVSNVDFRDFVRPPRTGKYTYASVIDFVEKGENNVKQAFWNLMSDKEVGASFTEALLRYYPVEKIAAAMVPKTKVHPSPTVKVVYPNDVEANKLPRSSKEKLLSQGYIIIDNRAAAQKSKYGVFEFTNKFTNPPEAGIYNYITAGGFLAIGMVFPMPKTFLNGFPAANSLLINIDSDKFKGLAYQVPTQSIFVKQQYKIADMSSIFSKLEEPSDGKVGRDTYYILLNEQLQASVPFRITQSYKDPSGLRHLHIEAYAQEARLKPNSFFTRGTGEEYGAKANQSETDLNLKPYTCIDFDAGRKQYHLLFSKREGSSFIFREDFLLIPKGYKLLEVEPRTCLWGHGNRVEKQEIEDYEATRKDYAPGGLYMLNALLHEKSVFPFTAHTNGSEYFMNVNGLKKKYATPVEAKIGMVLDFGLDEKEAGNLVSSLIPSITKSGQIKLAAVGDEVPPYQDEQPSTDDFGNPMYTGLPYENQVATSDGYTADPTRKGLAVTDTNDARLQSTVSQAAQLAAKGQKDLFDTQSIAALVKYVNPNDRILSYLPDFLTAIDKLGRTLVMLRWDLDTFEEMYGRDELPELVDLLKNTFDNLGDLVMYLKAKSPEVNINSNESASEIK